MTISLKEMQDEVKKYNQPQLLAFYDKLDEEKKAELSDQISHIDFNQMENLYKEVGNTHKNTEEKIEPIEYIEKSKLTLSEIEKYTKIGAEKISQGALAIVTMAGGQGTRLGHNGPKGTFMLGLNPDKSLFQILCEQIEEANKKYNVKIPWYIMTSKENNNQTIAFFEKNNYFNYDKELIKFFMQGELPMMDKSGKILLDEKGLVKLAADGHGGVFEAMFKNGVVEDMKKRHIEWVFIGPIDNPLAKMVDEVLIGISEETHAMGAGKSIVKANPQEKVGVFCKRDGKPSVVEYTEISEDMANATDNTGELLYGESHLNCNMFSLKGIEKIGDEKLPYHVAFKKAAYMDENGQIVNPDSPNAYKFESFIFDAFSKLDKMAILRVKREDEFAPVKNKEGVDSPETSRKLYIDFMKRKNV